MSTPETAPTPRPPRRRRWLRRFAYAFLALLLLGCAGILWLIGTQGGAQFAFGRIQQLIGTATNIEGIEGSIGGTLTIRRFEIVRPGLVVRIEGLEADISPIYTGRLTIRRLHARSVEVRTAPSAQPSPPMKAPPEFAPPFPVRLEDGAIGTFTYGAIASHDKDVVLADVVVRGEGEGTRWHVAEGTTSTPWGKVKISGYVAGSAPFDLDASASFVGTLHEQAVNAAATARGTLKSIELKAEAAMAGARAAASTNVRPFEPVLLGSIALDAGAVDLSRFAPSMPATRMSIQAKLAPRGDSLVGALRIANAQPGTWDSHHLPLVSASAELAASPDSADFSAIEVVLPTGSVRGHVHVGKSGAQAQLELTDVDLATLHAKLRKTQLAGKLAITGDRGAQRFEAAVEDPRFALEAHALLGGERLEVASASVRAGGGTVNAKGTLGLGGRRDFHVEGEAKNFDPSAFAATPKGDINFTFSVTGAMGDAPAGEATVDLKSSLYSGLPASGHLRIAGDAQRISRADVDLTLAEAHLTARGNLGRAGDAMDVSIRVPDLAKITRIFGPTVAGSVDARIKLAGTYDEGSVNAIVNAKNLLLPGELRQDAVRIALDGTRAAHRLDVTATLNSETTVHVAFQGGIPAKAEAVTWDGRIEALSMTGPGAFSLAAPATLMLSPQSAELGDARLRGGWGEAHLEVTRWAKGAFELKGAAPSIEIHKLAKSFGLEAPPRSDLVFSASWNLRASQSVDGNITVKRESGDIRVGDPELSMGLSDAMLAVDITGGKVRGTLNIAGSRVGSIRGEAHGEIASTGDRWELTKAAPVDARVIAAIPNLDVLAPWFGPDTKLGGRLDADLIVSGTGADPHMEAKARAQDVTLREARSGFEIAKGTASVHLDGKTLVIDELSARTPWRVPENADAYVRVRAPEGGGSIGASGSVDFGTHVGSIRVKIDKVPVMQLPRRFVAVSGEAKLEADGKGASVAGTFRADGGWIGALAQAPPSPSDDIVVVRAQAQPEETKSREPIRIDVTASLGDGIAFQGRGLDTRLVGEMRVVGEIGTPLRATGSIRTTEGTYEGYGQKLTIDRGVLTFAGPIDNPKLNVLATRKGLQVEPGLEVTGTSARPRVRLVSTPDVPESEKLSWLVLGRGAAGASQSDIGALTTAASALMGENRPGADLQKKLGIDEISVGHSNTGSPLGVMPQSTVAGRTGAPAATDVVTIGSQLTKDVRMSYEQGFADAEGALKVTWSITKQFQLLARAGYLPGLDVVYRWTIK